MTGHLNNNFQHFNDILWADAELELVSIDYDCIKVKIRESTGKLKQIRCEGYIGYENIGMWDEVIIESAHIYEQHALLERCLKSIEERHGGKVTDSGSKYRNNKNWVVLSISFIDKSNLNIVLAGIELENIV